MSDFQIVPSVGIWQLNPMDYALRNEYLDNLLSLSVNVLPYFYNEFGNCLILEGFTNKSNLGETQLFKTKRTTGCCVTVMKPSVTDVELITKLQNMISAKRMALSFILQNNKIFIIKELHDYSSIERIDNNKSILVYKK